jgi:hypothetical protein
MRKSNSKEDVLPDYDFSKGVRGKYSGRFAEGSNIVMIDPDVRKYFPDQKSVNEALRGLATLIERKKKVEHSR